MARSTRRLKLADSMRFIGHTPRNQYRTPSIKRIVVLMGFEQKFRTAPSPLSRSGGTTAINSRSPSG